jgi:pantoate kinase
MTLLEEIAQQRTNEVVYTSVAVTIEKIASEAARELLRDPAFKAELKLAAQRSIGRAFRDLRRTGRRPAARKAKRR